MQTYKYELHNGGEAMSKAWYDEHWRPKETADFVQWFTVDYGTQVDFPYDPYDPDEYWVRRGFALIGWLAAHEIESDDDLQQTPGTEERHNATDQRPEGSD